jgi:hypothetical protein
MSHRRHLSFFALAAGSAFAAACGSVTGPADLAGASSGAPGATSGDPGGVGAGGSSASTASSAGEGGAGAGGVGAGGGIVGTSYTTSPGYFDAVLDTERDQLFLSAGGDGVVRVVDLADGTTKTVTTGHNAEFMHFDPALDQVVISLPTAEHSSYWWVEDQEGYVAAIDATTLADPTPVWVPLDPWRLVADGTGVAHAASGSGQWTSAVSVDLGTGVWSLTSASIRENTHIYLHPDLERIYGADTGLSPSDIERWNIAGGAVQPAYDSPYHGDYEMCGDLRLHPDGNTIYTPCGHVFLASNVAASDMTWLGDLGLEWADLAFHPSGSSAYLLVEGAPAIYEYDTATLAPLATHPISAPAERVLTGSDYLVLVRSLGGGNPQTQVEVISYDSL